MSSAKKRVINATKNKAAAKKAKSFRLINYRFLKLKKLSKFQSLLFLK